MPNATRSNLIKSCLQFSIVTIVLTLLIVACGGNTSTSYACPSSAPLDCHYNNKCCPSGYPYHCANGTCRSTDTCSSAGSYRDSYCY